MDDKLVEILLGKLEEIKKEAKDAIRDTMEAVKDLKRDMDQRFDVIQHQLERINGKVDDEKSLNIRQEVRIENLEKDIKGLSNRSTRESSEIKKEMKKYDNLEKNLAVSDTKNKMVWAIGSAVITTIILGGVTALIKIL